MGLLNISFRLICIEVKAAMVEWAHSLFDKATWTNPKSAASWPVRSFYSEYKYGCADVMDLIWSATSLLVLELTATISI